jgi:HPt (histidine-containing phosphotransfer) domain-containing protein
MPSHRHPVSNPALNLDELLVRVDNDQDLLRELIAIFKGELPGQMSALRLAVAQNDSKVTEKVGHALKGMFLNLAAAKAAAAAAQLEELGRAQDTANLEAALAIFDAEVAAVVPELEAHLAKTEP